MESFLPEGQFSVRTVHLAVWMRSIGVILGELLLFYSNFHVFVGNIPVLSGNGVARNCVFPCFYGNDGDFLEKILAPDKNGGHNDLNVSLSHEVAGTK